MEKMKRLQTLADEAVELRRERDELKAEVYSLRCLFENETKRIGKDAMRYMTERDRLKDEVERLRIASIESDKLHIKQSERIECLRGINKELAEIAQSFRILLSHANKDIHPELQKRFIEAIDKSRKNNLTFTV